MRIAVAIAAFAGLVLAGYFLVHVGLAAILSALAMAGWGGFGFLCLSGLGLFVVLGSAWFALVPGQTLSDVWTFVWGRAVRDSAGELLPFSQVAAIVVGARAVMLRGVDGANAFASTVADITMELLAQIVFVAMGLVILTTRVPASHASATLVKVTSVSLLAASVGAALFLVVQRGRLGLVGRIAARVLPRAAAHASAVRMALAEIYAAPLRLLSSFSLHALSWMGTALWSWLAIRLMGGHAGFVAIFAVEALLAAIRSAAFLVPNAIGVQEAAYALLGPLFGVAPPMALAVSLLRRARDIVLGVPLLLAWQLAEGGNALSGNAIPALGDDRNHV